MNTMNKLMLPRLNYPFVAEIHSRSSQVEDGMVRWMVGFGLLADPDLARAIQFGRFGEFTSREYPTATDDGLQLITDIFGWLFALDDMVGDTGMFGQSPAHLSRFFLWVREIMDRSSSTQHDALGALIIENCTIEQVHLCQALGSATANIWQRMEACCSPPQYMRCVEAATYYFFGLIWEAGWHSLRCTPSATEYLVGRRFTTATPFGLALQDVAAGYEVPPMEYHRIDIRELNALVTLITALCNDIFSFPKERDEPRVIALNFPAVLIEHEGARAQEALERTAQLHNQLIEQYLTLEAAARHGASPQLLRFLAAMRSKMRGHYDWARHSPRYRLEHYFTGLDMT
ncbi:hypothetical protein [Pseudomonas sp. St290]|uniref:terpene synthase family protein n=1 Tax=Pseudomonas sp. St290 TaxID=1602166 RepID=UPI001BB32487|nr:hypothetical protein [Pseudomonas sp. St290]BBH35555.1 terpenoid synthase protein [Pseudomonas sp. St290]